MPRQIVSFPWRSWFDRISLADSPGWLISLAFHVLVLLLLLAVRVHQESATDTSLFSALEELPPDVNFDSATVDELGDSLDIGSFAATAGAGVAARSVETIQHEVREQIEQEFKAPEAPVTDEASPVAFDDLSGTVETTGGSVENLVHSGGVAGAIDRLAFEIVQSLHEQPTTVIWLFDRSQSLKERRDAIADRFENVYRQLASLDEGSNGSLATVVATYGDQFALLNERPTDDFKSLIPKVRKIEDDPSGRENVFSAVHALATKFRSERAKGRNVMIFIITDERGDDAPKYLEETILLCRRAGIRVYAVGNSSPFGREKGFVKWTYSDGFVEDVPVDAGPESVEPETLALGSGEIVAPICGGCLRVMDPTASLGCARKRRRLYFIAQDDRHGPTFSPAVMRNYTPDYRPIREYTVSLERNHAKSALVMASKQSAQAAQQKSLDDLRTPRLRFQAYNDTILREETTEAQKPAAELLYQIERLVGVLGGGEKDREKLAEPRWRAAFDLAAGRALAMKVRLLAYNQMLADMKGTPRAFYKSDSNEWRLVPSKSSDAGQAVKKLEKQAATYLQRVVDEHPGTPWAEIAQIELSTPLGWEWQEARNPASVSAEDQSRRSPPAHSAGRRRSAQETTHSSENRAAAGKAPAVTTHRELPGYGASLALHLTLALLLCLVHFSPELREIVNPIESYLEPERSVDEFTSELARSTASYEALDGGGGAVALSGGGGAGGGPALSHARLDVSEQLRDPTVAVSLGDTTAAIRDQLADDLGEGQVAGEPTAVVGGYGAAMSRISREIIRMLREERLIVAWLFDESESMKDDQREIQDEFHRVYDELGVFIEGEKKSPRDGDMLLSAIHSFGRDHRQITEKPTADTSEIRRAIDKIGVDDTGRENMFAAVNKVLDQYRPLASKTHRKLALVIVTDESGDDGDGPLLDEVIVKARKQKSPVYVLGRESVFGYPYAHIRWKDPKYGLTHWLRINRGPETAVPELLQFDGLHQRHDAHPSGFAPYEQARLTKETGGIFFVLPSEEQHIVNPADLDRRKFAFLDMKEYAPELIRRRDYEERRAHSRFRTAVWDVVRLLNPVLDKELNIQDDWYSTENDRFSRQGETAFKRGLRDMGLLNQAVQALEKVKSLRESESSPRWRANFDLASAQVRAYRVRLFQFLLIMDGYLNELPRPASAQHNVWNLQRSREMTAPTERQVKLTKIDVDELHQQLDQAKQQFEFVRRTHPGTPWAKRAEYELHLGFGMRWHSGFRDPRYDRRDITLPSL